MPVKRAVAVARPPVNFRAQVQASAGYDDEDEGLGKNKNAAGAPAKTPGQQVIRAVYDRWQLQLQRWADYRSLFSLMAFIAVFLGVLYAQRGATIAYQVHSTIASVVVPANNVLQSVDDVYSWLQGLLQTVWKDPVCGDGMCEAPFEFASFSRFGCKADCGRLSDIQNLTAAQVDIYWDFTHQAASLPASDLMSQVTWNLCPQDIQYSTACYDDPDDTFTAIAGTLSKPMTDLPDGDWALVLKKDIFMKTRGAVRDSVKVANAAFWYKLYIAAASAAAEQAYELTLLNTALKFLNSSMIDALPQVWAETDVNQAYRNADTFDRDQLRAATCLCDSRNVTDLLAGTVGWTNKATYLASSNCTGISVLNDKTFDVYGNVTITPYTLGDASLTGFNATCDKAFTNLTTHKASFNSTVQKYLIVQRLGNLKDTGKFGVRYNTASGLKTFLNNNYPELVDLIYTNPTGADPHTPAAASLTALMNLYVESDLYLLTGAPAHLALYRRRLNLDAGVTFATYANRTIARVAEIGVQQANVSGISMAGPNSTTTTIAAITAAFKSAGANTTVLPASTDINQFAVDYNLASWDGNTTAYLTCNLDIRGPDYVGKCTDLPVQCVVNPGSDTNPYNCTRFSDNSTVAGSIRNVTYREQCEVPCDEQVDCDTLCECWDSCTGNTFCSCSACTQMHADAALDTDFLTIQDAAAKGGAASADIIASTSPSSNSGRRLLQSATQNITDQLATVLASVSTLSSAQDSIAGQMSALQSQVDKANLLAAARAASTTVQDLITAGRSDIKQGQAVLETKLDTLLQRQQAAIDAMNAANNQIAAVQALSERQTDALAALDAATKDRLSAISVATQQGVINLYQALAVWKMARRDRALSNKITKLAGQPCSYDPNTIEFSVNNNNGREDTTARERTLGLNNRVLAGLFLHTWRTMDQRCPPSRFSQIQNTCAGKLDVTPYGVDSVFKLGSVNFDPDLYDPAGAMMAAIYNCSQLQKPSYNIIEPLTKLTVNPPPFCAELFNPRQIPYAFWHLPLKGIPDGFPVLLDINLSQEGAQTWVSWIQEGLLLDSRTQGLIARLISYNAELKVFAAIQINFNFQPGGSIEVTNRIYTLSLELYDATPANLSRYAFEVMLAAFIVLLNLIELWELLRATFTARGRRQGGLRGYLSHGSVWLELINNVLLLAAMGLWWCFVNQHAKVFSMDLRYPVYQALEPQAYFLQLADNGAGLQAAWDAFSQMEEAISVLNWYYALNGTSILLLIARLLRAMDFQPRLGVVTRALQLAAPDLLHFFLVAGSVFICYCMMGFLIFGNSLSWFATFGTSVNTCFEMLLGNFGDVNTDLRALGGLQSAAGALFFWSFELLVFLILLNFLLAIIVDAFSEVKNNTHEQTGIHVELYRLLTDKWRWFVGTWTGRYIGARTLDQIMREWAGIVEEEEAAAAAEAAASAQAAAGKHRTSDDDEDNAPRVLQVLGETVDEAALTQILMDVLQDESTADDPKAAASAPPVGEVEAAARFIIKRFGKSAQRVAEEALKEMGPAGQELEEERDKLAAALERLAGVQRELAEAQRNLMMGQKQLGQQQNHLVGLITQNTTTSSLQDT